MIVAFALYLAGALSAALSMAAPATEKLGNIIVRAIGITFGAAEFGIGLLLMIHHIC